MAFVFSVFGAVKELFDFELATKGLLRVLRESRSFKKCSLLAFLASNIHPGIAISTWMIFPEKKLFYLPQ